MAVATNPTIRLGSTGEAVTRWQQLLTAAGHSVAASGTFDQATADHTKMWQAEKGLVADGIVGPASWAKMTGFVQGGNDPHAAFGRQVLSNIWQEVTGETPSLSSLQIAGAQAHLESNYGRASYRNSVTGETSGVINNWGAVQAHGDQPGFLATDTHADGSVYQAKYRIYPTPEDGAKDMLKQMTTRRPTSWGHMRRGDIDAWSAQMRTKDPETGVLGYFEQSAEGRAKGIEQRVANIAHTLNEPVAAKRGGPMPDESTTPEPVISPEAEKGLGILALLAMGYAGYRYFAKGKIL